MTANTSTAANGDTAINEALVRSLLTSQHPDLAHQPLQLVASGWDNTIFLLGDDLAVRLPHRSLSAALVVHEQRWLPVLAPSLPLPIPVPIRVGRPSDRYPWHWSVVPWLPGRTAADTPLRNQLGAAKQLASFLSALHHPAPADAPDNPYRGISLPLREVTVLELLGRAALPGHAAIRERWASLVATPPWPHPPVWIHADLHPANIVVADDAIAAVIDFGDLCAGDPAVDYAAAWMLFDEPARTIVGATTDGDTWARAHAWALALSVAYLANHADSTMTAIATKTLRNLGLIV